MPGWGLEIRGIACTGPERPPARARAFRHVRFSTVLVWGCLTFGLTVERDIASNDAMRVETFWAAWAPIRDFRRRLHKRLQLSHRLAELELERHAALEAALRVWALCSLPVAAPFALPMVLWWPVGNADDPVLVVGVMLQGAVGVFAWPVAARGGGPGEPLALTELAWADMVEIEAAEEPRD